MDEDTYDGDNYKGVAWYCDKCGALLNKQYGFSDNYDSWTCTECGYTNGTTEDDIIEGTRFGCPNCYATLNKQFCFNQYLDDWECAEFLIFLLLSENIRKSLTHSDCTDTAFGFGRCQPLFSSCISEIMLYGDSHFLKVDVIPQRARHSPHRIPL